MVLNLKLVIWSCFKTLVSYYQQHILKGRKPDSLDAKKIDVS